jgi:DNA phosphorothioation-associated putative methyltransferase
MSQTIPHKKVGSHSYYYFESIPLLDSETRSRISAAEHIAKPSRFNVVKLFDDRGDVTLLDYPSFYEEAFPQLANYWTVSLADATYRHRSYESSLNPPILHRKELLLSDQHPSFDVYCALTESAEQIGLFDDPIRIGFKRAWDSLLQQRGYKVAGHELLPLGNDESLQQEETAARSEQIARHLTALTRYGFSAPIQALARLGFLDGSKSVFDYGCGRGDDLRGLRENDIQAAGWDPYFAPDGIKHPAHIVNLGFVINVIEDIDERIQALRGAYSLTQEVLVVSAMLANQEAVSGTPYGDGIRTSRNTFQKYYTQGELRQFLQEVIGEEPIPVGPGIFFLFKDKDAEQRFMYGRMENRRNILRLSQLSRPAKPIRVSRAEEKYLAHQNLLEELWEMCLIYGRDPDRTEVSNLDEVTSIFGSLPAALRFIKSRKENVDTYLNEARKSRIDDLRMYFAQLAFEKRKPYRHLEARLQRDIRIFFGDYRNASDTGRELLFTVAKVEAIGTACHEAAEHGIGWLEDSESLQLHTSLVEQLPAVLRTYVHCGTKLYGDVSSADLIKIHIRSGKLTLMKFDDFVGKPLPKMLQRIKLNLRTQDMDVFDYGDQFEPPYLYRKSRFINEEFSNYPEQAAIEESMENAGLLPFSGYGPTASEFDRQLEARRYAIDGFSLVRSRSIPDIDAPCGQYLTYRQLIECGETQARTGIPNRPKEPDSYTALLELAEKVLDPVIEYFGAIKLTYGFCSHELAKQIPGRVSPPLDQHAAHERKRNGKYICDRLGAACDFFIEDENMEEVAAWIVENTNFDRIYLIDSTRPIHISASPTPARQIVRLYPGPSGRLIPKVVVLVSHSFV